MAHEYEAMRAKEILTRLVVDTDAQGNKAYSLDDEGRLELDEMMHALARSPDGLTGASYSYDMREFIQDFHHGDFAFSHLVYDVRDDEASVRIYLRDHPKGLSNPYFGDSNQVWNFFSKTSDDFREGIARTLAIYGKDHAPGYQALFAPEPPPAGPSPSESDVGASDRESVMPTMTMR
ncbi:hypothetical protein OIU34_20620 [Pararhizobium sp. BT-229]|uniref:hypothetical protein n=1 Tax=Pararhizobium sp. BT-229 TaxID=2986923 RepID=UPI0021F72AF2|nr:hypothetical protein [Pararhizobium sp. BT-229]MCV9964294.1 hypothetical protein [Pararhizobium sp. BT-229]